MHHLQIKIIYQLALHDGRRFSQLKPRDMESNQFMYHLKNVIAQGYVEKQDQLYVLTAKGKQYVVSLSSELLQTRQQPVTKTMIYAENKAGEQLLYKINRQPRLHKIGFVNGKIHFGEDIKAAAKRELAEKSGLSGDLQYRGVLGLRSYEGEELFSHEIYFVFVADYITGTIEDNERYGQSHWAKLASIAESDLFPSLLQIQQYIKTSPQGFYEEVRITQ